VSGPRRITRLLTLQRRGPATGLAGRPAAELGTAPPGLEFIRLQGHSPQVLVYFPGLIDATFEAKELVRRRQRLFGPWLPGRTLYIVSRRRPLPEGWTIPQMAADYAEAARWIAEREKASPGELDIAGASFGGCIAMQFALDHPALLRRLVLQQVAARGDPQKQALARTWIEDLERGRYLPVARGVLNHSYRERPRVLNDLLALSTWPLMQRNFERRCSDLARSLRAIDGYDVMTELRRVRAPTLVLGGGRDQMVPEALMRETAAALPDGRLMLFPDGSHNVQSEYTAEYARALLKFLDGGTAAPAP
jgi:pimeloyl-ACP methyl ester carboxylesterase